MGGYYRQHLSGPRLQSVYELASPRIAQYLRAEIGHVIDRLRGADRVLELGCGYGRALKEIAPFVGRLVGIDRSRPSLQYAASYLSGIGNCDRLCMNAVRLGFREDLFDAVFCIQNGISAFAEDPSSLITEAVRVARSGGVVLFSTYSPRIWGSRLDWFRAQSSAGLLGELDEARSAGGTIVCKDGFQSRTVRGDEFRAWFEKIGQRATIREVDESSIFAEVVKAVRR